MPPAAPTSSTSTPDRSLEQRLEALQRANDIRTKRAQLKKQIKAGEADVLPVLLEPGTEHLTMKVWDLLKARPKIGRVKANQILKEGRISPSKTLGGLSPRQREELAQALARAPRVAIRS